MLSSVELLGGADALQPTGSGRHDHRVHDVHHPIAALTAARTLAPFTVISSPCASPSSVRRRASRARGHPSGLLLVGGHHDVVQQDRLELAAFSGLRSVSTVPGAACRMPRWWPNTVNGPDWPVHQPVHALRAAPACVILGVRGDPAMSAATRHPTSECAPPADAAAGAPAEAHQRRACTRDEASEMAARTESTAVHGQASFKCGSVDQLGTEYSLAVHSPKRGLRLRCRAAETSPCGDNKSGKGVKAL